MSLTGVFSHQDGTAFRQRISCRISRKAFLPQLFTYEESVFSFCKLYILDCFSSMCKLIATAGSNFLEGYRKYCGIGK